MRIPKTYFDMANAGLGVKDAASLVSVVRKYSPASSGKICPQLLEKLKAKGLLAFVGNPPVTFTSEAAAREVIADHYAHRGGATAPAARTSAPEVESIRQEVAQLRADLLAEIAKLSQSVEQLRGDVDALRNAQISERTRRETDHGALVEILAEMQLEVAAVKNAVETAGGQP